MTASTSLRDAPSLRGMRVCILLEAAEVGGAEKQALLLGRHLAVHEGCDVQVWTLMPSKRGLAEELQLFQLPSRHLDFEIPTRRWRWALLVFDLARLLREARIDIILPFCTLPNVLAGLAFRLAGARLSVWNERVASPSIVATRTMRLAAKLTPVFIANSKLGAECIVRVFGERADRVNVVWNGVALRPAVDGRDVWRRRLGVAPDTIVVTMVANVHGRKDHATLLEAFSRATAQRPKDAAQLVCAGSTVEPTYGSLLVLARELGLGDRVTFLGHVSDIAGLLEASDLAAFSSHEEGTPNGVLEAMAKNLAVVATDLPGIRDVLDGNGEHWLVPPSSPEVFSDRLRELMDSPSLRAKVADENYAVVMKKFSTEAMGRTTAAVIRGALRRGCPLRAPRFARPASVTEPPRSNR